MKYFKLINEIRLMGHIASTIKVNKYGFAYIELDEDILNSLGADASAASNMINDFNNINETSGLCWSLKSKVVRFIKRFVTDPYKAEEKEWIKQWAMENSVDVIEKFRILRDALG